MKGEITIPERALKLVLDRSRTSDDLGRKIKEALAVIDDVLSDYGWVSRVGYSLLRATMGDLLM
jgi:hypothetical protein